MGNLAKNICNFIKAIIFDCYEKFCQKEIFFSKKVSEYALKINKTFSQMSKKEKYNAIESLQIISSYNSDFNKLKYEYLNNSTGNINLEQFKIFIRNVHSGYYFKKAVFFLIIRFLYIIAQFLMIIYLKYPKYLCLSESIKDNNDYYWTNGNYKYKVKIIKIDTYLKFRILILFVDIIIIVFEIGVLKNLQKIKIHKVYLILYQLIKYVLFCFIIIRDFFYNDYCEISNKTNLFYKKNNKNKILEKLSFTFGLLKIIIN